MRQTTGAWRALPDFLILGAQRCGTSSLYKYLGAHPHVVASIRKEVEYFSFDYSRGESWYRGHFPMMIRMHAARVAGGVSPQTFEASPGYLLDPRAPRRAASVLPRARLIVLVRNPVDRALSHYLHNRLLNHEPLQFEDALSAERDRLKGEMDRLTRDPAYPAKALRRFSYVERGMYADQLKGWLEYFAASQLLVVRSEDLYIDPSSTFATILRFLDLPQWEPAEFRNFSRRVHGAETDTMAPRTRERLLALFERPNRSLEDLLGRDMAWGA